MCAPAFALCTLRSAPMFISPHSRKWRDDNGKQMPVHIIMRQWINWIPLMIRWIKWRNLQFCPCTVPANKGRQRQRERDWLNWTQYSTLSHSLNLWLHKIYSTFIYTECAKITLTQRTKSYKKVWEQCVFRTLRQLTKWLIVAIVGDKQTAIAKERVIRSTVWLLCF